MIMICIIVKILKISLQISGGDLSVLMRNCYDLMSVCLDGASLVYADMSGLCSNYSLIRSQLLKKGKEFISISLLKRHYKFFLFDELFSKFGKVEKTQLYESMMNNLFDSILEYCRLSHVSQRDLLKGKSYEKIEQEVSA